MLKMTQIQLELMTDIKMYQFMERRIEGVSLELLGDMEKQTINL